MSSLEPRRGSGLSRSAKERRAYQLVVVGAVAGLVAIVGMVLAIAGVMGGGIPLIAAVVAVVCFVVFRRLTASRSRY
jgi:F0F1-type ATP synthase assembly protein I